MANRIRRRACGTLLLFIVLFLLPGVASGEPVSPDPDPVRVMNVPHGYAELDLLLSPGPANVLFWHYADEDELPWCLELSDDPPIEWVTLMNETFVTNSTTSYVEIDWTGQFTVLDSASTYVPGLLFRVRLTQGVTTAYFPGAGDGGTDPYAGVDDGPYMSRCDIEGYGPQWYGGYHGTLPVAHSTSTTLEIELYCTADEAYACFQNVTVRYD